MKRSGAIGLVVGVVAVAALLMYFFVMPQIRDGKTVEDIAKQAGETVKQTVNDAAKQVEEVADGVEEIKAIALGKMARLGVDAKTAADELQAVLAKQAPTAEEVAAAKAKLKAALTSMASLELPKDADSTLAAMATKVTDGAKAAVAALDALPADPAAARAALADIKTKLLATLPQGAALLPADATTPVATEDKAAATDTKTGEQTADGATTAEQTPDPADDATPAFDILRVEKDGSTVIAGRAEPGAKVEIVNGNDVIAATQADTSGDFAAVLDNPLSSGDHSITLKATTKDGKSAVSEEVATVSVPKDETGELLAMVTKPGEASKIITMPEDKQSEVASNKSVTPDATTEAAKADGSVPVTETAKVEDSAKTDAGTTDTKATDVAVTTPDLPDSSSDIASTPPVVGDAAGNETAGAQQTASADPAASQSAATTSSDAAQPVAAPEVMVSAVEIEGDRIFIAGNTRPGATVRVYADDQIVAEATADKTGRFVADGTIKLAVGNHTIRADVLSANGAKVEFRASVPFFRPEGDLAAVASADAKDNPAIEPLANGTFDKARDEAGKALALLKGLYADGKTPSGEELAAARSSAEIALKSLADVHVEAGVDPGVAAMAKTASDEARKALDRLKSVPTDAAAFKSALGEIEATVASAVKPNADVASENEVAKAATPSTTTTTEEANAAANDGDLVEKTGEQKSADEVKITAKVNRLAKSTETTADGSSVAASDEPAKADAQSSSQETASADQPKVIEQAPLKQSEGSVIIRRGDTLWQISRRVYGKGVRYTTIYVANRTQIEDPDRIKPGQIFTMPGKWLDNAEELHKKHLKHEE